MKSFCVHDGDVVVNKTIEMTQGSELLRQKAELVIGTNKGEWEFDAEEGIDFPVILCKNPDDDEIRASIEDALVKKVDETFAVTEYSREMDGRNATIRFKAVNGDGEAIEGGYTYAG